MSILQELILVGWVEPSGTQHFQGFVGFRLRSTQPTTSRKILLFE